MGSDNDYIHNKLNILVAISKLIHIHVRNDPPNIRPNVSSVTNQNFWVPAYCYRNKLNASVVVFASILNN